MNNAVSVDRLGLMETFVRIVEAGSLTAAATLLGATQPTVSRRLTALEQSLGVRLLQRSTHVMRLTVDGERCYARAKELLADWQAFEADLRGAEQEPEGHLRVAVPHAFGQEKLIAPLAAFLSRHPRVTVEWLLLDTVPDFLASGIDCAIQVGEPTDPAAVAVKLTEVPRIVVAAPSVLGGMPVPRDPAELAALPWIAIHTYYRNALLLRHGITGEVRSVEMRPRMSTDSLYALRGAALQGIGVCAGSAWLLAADVEQGRLVQLAPDWRAAPLPVYLSYPRARHDPSRLARFIALMREAVPPAVGG
ncbi:MAG: LysR family transcriptional regulator [Pseudomonadota bacterium]